MASILDQFPFPWHTQEAQQLRTSLGQLFPSGQAALLVVQRTTINTGLINFQQAPVYVWHEVLAEAARAGQVRELVEQVATVLPQTSLSRPFLEDLLADRPTRSEGERRTDGGAPRFISQSDEVGELEALLYHDDLTIPIGRVPSLIDTLQRLAALAPAVCRLEIDVDGLGMHGTGFRIAHDLLLTTWHVLYSAEDERRATAVTAEFGYEDDGYGGALAATAAPCDVATIAGSQRYDWAIIRTTVPLPDRWPLIKLSAAAVPHVGTPAYIIQHPGGQRKRLAFVRNQVTAFDERTVHYLTDTQAGSSGAPVFNGEGQLIAIHHAGGRPQEVVGRAPLKKNEGIRIAAIVAGLEGLGISVPQAE